MRNYPNYSLRLKYIRKGLAAFADIDPSEIRKEDIEDHVTDMLADLMHLAKTEEFSFANCMEWATKHFNRKDQRE